MDWSFLCFCLTFIYARGTRLRQQNRNSSRDCANPSDFFTEQIILIASGERVGLGRPVPRSHSSRSRTRLCSTTSSRPSWTALCPLAPPNLTATQTPSTSPGQYWPRKEERKPYLLDESRSSSSVGAHNVVFQLHRKYRCCPCLSIEVLIFRQLSNTKWRLTEEKSTLAKCLSHKKNLESIESWLWTYQAKACCLLL